MREYKTYFAASNSYTGFVSHFDKIFSPIVLNKLYILKGGPGTGKSTIMKEISNRFAKECDVTNILCSSDPESFDGVLLECNGVTVGIVDGTAPHIVDPIYPGAVEEIINLGDAFDFEALQNEKKCIVELSKLKKLAYSRAYNALSQAGGAHGYILSSFSDINVNSRAECLIGEKIKLKECEDFYVKNIDYKLSAFCKNGLARVSIKENKKQVISVCGDGISEYVVMESLYDLLKKKGYKISVFTSPLSGKLIDAIETDEYIFLVSTIENADISSAFIMPDSEEYKRVNFAYKSFIANAQSAFLDAAKHHAGLEGIYTKSTHFEINDVKKKKIIEEIDALFDNNQE